MNKFAIRILALAMYSIALIATPLVSAFANGGETPTPPPMAKAEARGTAISAIEYIASAKSLIANLLIHFSRCLVGGSPELSAILHQRPLM